MRRLLASVALASVLCGSALAQTAPLKWFSAATTNATLAFGKKALLGTGVVVNTTAAVYYLKLYDKATAPVCGTDTPVWTIPIPFGASSSAGGFVLPLGAGLLFAKGVGFCITGMLADNDTTPAATGIVVNLGVSGR